MVGGNLKLLSSVGRQSSVHAHRAGIKEDGQEIQAPDGLSLDDLLRLAEAMLPGTPSAEAASGGRPPAADQDIDVMRLAHFLLSKVWHSIT